MGSLEQAPGCPLKMLLCQGCGMLPVETGFSPSPCGSRSRSESGCSYAIWAKGVGGQGHDGIPGYFSSVPGPHQTGSPISSPVGPSVRHQGVTPGAVQMPEPIPRQSWGRKSSASSTGLCRGAHAHPTGSLGPGWRPVSLVSEGACLAALHLQQFRSVEWGMDG